MTNPTQTISTWLGRAVLLAIAIFALSCRSGSDPQRRSSASEIVVLSYGGEFAEAQREAYYAPFTKATGIPIAEASYNGEYGKLKAAVQGGSVPWSVVDIESSMLLRGLSDGIFQRIDYKRIRSEELLPAAVHEFAVGTDLYSVSLGFNTNKFPTLARQPKNWRDFWDTKTFPGPRTMKKDPKFTLEIALLADGVPLDQVYAGGKLDVDRAFRSLNRIKNSVAVWWTSGQQPIELLTSGEVVMAAAFGARMYNASKKEHKPVSMTWNQGIIDVEYWAVLKGAPNGTSALAFIDFASRPDRQAAMAQHIPLGPVNKRAFEFLQQSIAVDLNTYPANYSRQLLLSAEYWANNEETIRARFNRWLGQ